MYGAIVIARNSPATSVTLAEPTTLPFTSRSTVYVPGARVRFASEPINETSVPFSASVPALTFAVMTRSVEVEPGPYRAPSPPLPFTVWA